MTITLTKEELETFQNKLTQWSGEALKYVLENLRLDPMTRSFGVAQVDALLERFTDENPKPNWRTLL